MEFSLFNLMPLRETTKPVSAIYDETLEMVRMAEELEFSAAWFAEHHFSNYSMCPSPLVMAAYCAARTTTIQVGTACVVLPLYNPLRLLQEVGMVEALSHGRLLLGIGSGYQGYEFERYGIPLDERWDRTVEILDILEMAFKTGRAHYEGSFYRVPNAPIGLKPEREIPVFVTGGAPALLQLAARRGFTPFVTAGSGPREKIKQIRDHVETHFANEGRTDDVPFAVQRMVYITDSKAEARRAAEQRLYTERLANALRGGSQKLKGWELVPTPFSGETKVEEVIENNIVGDSETCIEGVLRDIELFRPTHYSCFMQMGDTTGPDALKSLERFGSEVLPAVRKALSSKNVVCGAK